MKTLIALLLSTLLSAPLMAETATPSGTPALFRDFAGQAQSIDAYTGDGKWLVVMIWAHNCHICNQEAAAYAKFHNDHQARDARVLGLSLDGAEQQAEAEAFIKRHALPFPNLIGEPQKVAMRYVMLTGESFRGTPSLLLYGPDGKLRAAQAGAVPITSLEAFIARNSQAATDAAN